MRRSILTLALPVVALIGAAACSDVAEPRPLSIELSANPTTVSIGDTIAFEAVAEGFEIIRITVDLDDDEVKTFEYPAFTRASANFIHAYEQPGTYDVTATVLDLRGGEITDRVTITVTVQ